MSQPPTTSRPHEPAKSPKPFQFGLRDLFLVITAVCGLLGAYAAGGVLALLLAGGVVLSLGVAHYGQSPFYATLTLLGYMLIFLVVGSNVNAVSSLGGRRGQCSNNLRQITLALLYYESQYGAFPPAYTVDANGNRLHSWRTLILPQLECVRTYSLLDLNQPWDAPANQQGVARIPDIYACPSRPEIGQQLYTSYVAVVGPDTMWPGESGRALSEVTDGAVHTIVLIEITRTDIHWAEPRDLTLDEVLEAFRAGELTGISSYHTGRQHVITAAATVRSLDLEQLDEATLRAMFIIDDGEPERYP